MKRLCIFSYYDAKGEVRLYVEHLLNELNKCSSRIIFAVNGYLSDAGREIIKRYTSEIYIRDNCGYDAGAYKDVIFDYLNSDIKGYDEIIFCNNSFYGPFIPMDKIFDEMSLKEENDFWGLCYTENNFANHIPGMFFVFKKNIINKSLIQEYFKKYINEKTKNKEYVIVSYEIGLFDFLVRKHKLSFQYYSAIGCLDIYKDAEICIRKSNLPILKRRIGEEGYYDKDKVCSVLKLISEKFDYDIQIILRDLSDDYGIDITENDILTFSCEENAKAFRVLKSPHSYEEIKKFSEEKKFYIMGAGFYSLLVWWLYARENNNFLGFFISDNRPFPKEQFFKNNTYYYSEIDLNDKNVLIVLNKRNTLEILSKFKQENVLCLSV